MSDIFEEYLDPFDTIDVANLAIPIEDKTGVQQKKYVISNAMDNFLLNNGIDINQLPEFFYKKLVGSIEQREIIENDFDYNLTFGNRNYEYIVNELISIEDIVGISNSDESITFFDYLKLLYGGSGGYDYSSRVNHRLKKDMIENIQHILNSNEPLRLAEINGKYYLSSDGNHRTAYLILSYYILLEKYKNDLEKVKEIKEKFKINVNVIKKSPYEIINNVCYCLSKLDNDDIKLEFGTNDDNICIMNFGGKSIPIRTESEFINYFEQYLDTLDKTENKYIDLIRLLKDRSYYGLLSSLEIKSKSDPHGIVPEQYFNVNKVLQEINPALLSKNIKLPNGNEISVKQYIEDVVYPQLPRNGIVILKNGVLLSVKQFIEENVIFDCQENYNGDFARYMNEETRNNMGVISIQKNDGIHQIKPEKIIEFINPALLDKVITLSNGIQIPAWQYIQQFYAPHINSNGRVILDNGYEISAVQFIEEFLLFDGQTKYLGDISQILYNATRNNNGYVEVDLYQIKETLLNLKIQQSMLISQELVENQRHK